MKIRTSDTFLGEHLRLARAGVIAPADFQRSYAWTKDDVLALWDSILLGFPVGFATVWDVSYGNDRGRPCKDRLGPWSVSPSSPERLILIDGQNRLATLAWSIAEPAKEKPADLSDRERETWASGHELVIDPKARCIRFADSDEAADGVEKGSLGRPGWLGVDGFGTFSLMGWFRQATKAGVINDDDLTWVSELADKLRETRIPITRIESAEAEDVLRVFRNLNRAGRPVTDQELAAALGIAVEDGPRL